MRGDSAGENWVRRCDARRAPRVLSRRKRRASLDPDCGVGVYADCPAPGPASGARRLHVRRIADEATSDEPATRRGGSNEGRAEENRDREGIVPLGPEGPKCGTQSHWYVPTNRAMWDGDPEIDDRGHEHGLNRRQANSDAVRNQPCAERAYRPRNSARHECLATVFQEGGSARPSSVSLAACLVTPQPRWSWLAGALPSPRL